MTSYEQYLQTNIEEFFGLQWYPDERDKQFPAATRRRMESDEWRYWWPSGWHGNQGRTPQCVAYAVFHAWIDGPVTAGMMGYDYEPPMTPTWLYCESQARDPWDGDCSNHQYDGTSVRAAAKAMVDFGYIDEYRWVFDVDELCEAVIDEGPVIMGSRWDNGMMDTDEEGYVHVTGSGNYGHAYVINGVNMDREVARIKNSWGREWGYDGYAWISLDDLGLLMEPDWVEGCQLDLHDVVM